MFMTYDIRQLYLSLLLFYLLVFSFCSLPYF